MGKYSKYYVELWLVGLIFTALGCASKSPQKAGGNPAPGSNTPQFNQQQGTAGVVTQGAMLTSCLGTQGPAANAPASKIVDGRSMTVTVNEIPTTLCDVLRANNKKVAIFQFAGADCLSCIDEAKATQAALAASGRLADVMHVIAFTDRRDSGFTPQDYQGFLTKNAPSASIAHDYEQVMWNYVNPKTRPATLIMNNLMQALTVTKPEQEASTVPMALSLIPIR